MRFEVPQFIEIEDKIFGPFTWRQFVYLAGGVGLAVVLFITTPLIVFALIGIPFSILAGLLAFYPINNRPFSQFLESAVTFFSSTKLYTWKKKGSGVYSADNTPAPQPSSNTQQYNPTIGRNNLHSLSQKLELDAIKQE